MLMIDETYGMIAVECRALRHQFRALRHLVLSSVMLVWQGLEECSMVKL